MSTPAEKYSLAEVRELTERFKAGGASGAHAFRELASLLLRATILHQRSAVRLTTGPQSARFALAGWGGPLDPLLLNDGHLLRMSVVLFLEETPSGERLKVETASYQYQVDPLGDLWIFRYDYLRVPRSPHPASHLQIRGRLDEDVLPRREPLGRVHFPTGRVSLEAVIRLLVEQFHVRCHEPDDVWRPLLSESERLFLDIAHRPLSGPER